jgi:BirA family biotin operon repressor/biotin-[acetyl-CoA-carboxylase] ligase
MPVMIQLNIRSPFEGAPVFFKSETESTMTDAKSLASQGFPPGTVIAADHQTAGRGRFPERKWEAAPGDSLLFTVFFKTGDLPGSPGLLPLKSGLALARTLEREFALQARVKWPNDVYVKDRKLAGILAEVRGDHVFLGMGINCLQKGFSKELKNKAVALRQVTNKKFTPPDLLPSLLVELKECLFGQFDWKAELEKRLFLKDEIITFVPGLPAGGEIISGRLAGILDDGRLVLKTEESAEPAVFAAGEIRFEAPKRFFL